MGEDINLDKEIKITKNKLKELEDDMYNKEIKTLRNKVKEKLYSGNYKINKSCHYNSHIEGDNYTLVFNNTKTNNLIISFGIFRFSVRTENYYAVPISFWKFPYIFTFKKILKNQKNKQLLDNLKLMV